MFIALFRIVKFSLQDFLRNFWLSVATIIILILTLISINFLLTLNFIKKHVKENGIVIFSTVQEKMLMGGPILDFIMWTYGWRMYFKADDEPGKMATSAGYKHEKRMDWEDDYGYNRMTVARKPKTSFLRVISNTAKQIKLLLF